VQFTDASTSFEQCDIMNRLWDFGDGETSTDVSPSHTYTASGTYTVSLTATSGGGLNTETKEGYVVVMSSGDDDSSDDDTGLSDDTKRHVKNVGGCGSCGVM